MYKTKSLRKNTPDSAFPTLVVGTQKNRLGSFKHQKNMLKLMNKKIFTIYTENFCLSGPMHSAR